MRKAITLVFLVAFTSFGQTRIDRSQIKNLPDGEGASASWCAAPSMVITGNVLTIGPRWGESHCRLRFGDEWQVISTPVTVTIPTAANIYGATFDFWLHHEQGVVTTLAIRVSAPPYQSIVADEITGVETAVVINLADEYYEALWVAGAVKSNTTAPGQRWVYVGQAYTMSGEWSDVWPVLGLHQITSYMTDKITVLPNGSDLIIDSESPDMVELLEVFGALTRRVEALEAR